jgi:hypothetical protein
MYIPKARYFIIPNYHRSLFHNFPLLKVYSLSLITDASQRI